MRRPSIRRAAWPLLVALIAGCAIGSADSARAARSARPDARRARAVRSERSGERAARRRTTHARRVQSGRERGFRHRDRRIPHPPTARHHPTLTPTAAGTASGSGSSTAGSAPSGSSSGTATGASRALYVDPNDSALQEVASLRASGDPTDAAALAPIASQPEAMWLTDSGSASSANVSAITTAAAAAGQLPVLVVYDLPWRDCGQYSSGGAASPSAYDAVIDGIASGLAQRPAMLIIEPDALSELSCLPASEQTSYYQMLQYAVGTLGGDHNAQLYVDAGNPGWQSPAAEAAGLNQVVQGTSAGFAVNVSNFYSPAASIAYGTAISQLAGGRHFVIDTSRDGASVPSGDWCNPAGARLGPDPTTTTGNPLLDAELWIKTPGESDGTCNGGPSAGQFWLSYALALAGS